MCYKHGNGVDIDLKKAAHYFNLAAKQNNIYAINHIGVCYEKGNGVDKDLLRAMYYYTLSADNGRAAAKTMMESLQKNEEFQKLLYSTYLKLQQDNEALKQENIELRLRPPTIGGPEYEEAKESFNKRAKIN